MEKVTYLHVDVSHTCDVSICNSYIGVDVSGRYGILSMTRTLRALAVMSQPYGVVGTRGAPATPDGLKSFSLSRNSDSYWGWLCITVQFADRRTLCFCGQSRRRPAERSRSKSKKFQSVHSQPFR